MGMFNRRKAHAEPVSRPFGIQPYPGDVDGYQVGPAPNYAPISVTPSWTTNGRYGRPLPTMVAANVPGVQRRCGVEAIDRNYQVGGKGDVPYWLQTQQSSPRARTLRTGARAGESAGPATVAPLLGPQRLSAAQEVQGMVSGLLGW